MGKKGCNNYIIRDNIMRGLRLNEDGEIVLPTGRLYQGKKTAMNGYRMISLSAFGKSTLFQVSRIICWLVHGPPPFEEAEVDHKNRNKLDERPDNLRWASSSQNLMNVAESTTLQRRAFWKKMGEQAKGEGHGHSKLTEAIIHEIFRLREEGWKQVQIAQKFSIGRPYVSQILSADRWKHLRKDVSAVKGLRVKCLGESNHNSKLTEEKVREIRRLRNGGMKYEDISKLIGISKETVADIVRGRYWKHVK